MTGNMPRPRLLAVALVAALAATPVRAAEIDRFLPADTEVYMVVNVRQIVNSALIKKIGVENIRAIMLQQEEVAQVFKDLGLDPFKDVDKIIQASPSTGEEDKGLVIVHGRFDVEKIRRTAAQQAKDNKDVLKEVKVGGETIYEVAIPDVGKSLFVGIASTKTILAAMSKDYLLDGLKVKDATKAALKNTEFQKLLTKLDDKESMSVVLSGAVLTKGQLDQLPAEVKNILKKVDVGQLGITLTDGLRMDVTVNTKTADDAKTIKDELTKGINAAIGLIALAGQPQLAPAADFLKSIKTTSKDKSVSMKAELSAEDLAKLLPKDQ